MDIIELNKTIEEIKDKEMLKLRCLEMQRFYDSSDYVELYFTYKKIVYSTILKKEDIPTNFFKLDYNYYNKQHTIKNYTIRITLNNTKKEYLLNNFNCIVIGLKEYIKTKAKEEELNVGEYVEKISCKKRNIEYKRNNIKFYEAGDINMKTRKISVKSENATLCSISTLIKLGLVIA